MPSDVPRPQAEFDASQDRRVVERQALESVLASEGFDRSKSLSRVLSYVCTKYFDGQADEIKEYNIAVEALGRPADFDQKKDAIVRVEMHRLRKRLRDYYRETGSCDPVQIVIAEKGYVPEFVVRSAERPLQEVTAVSGAAPANGKPAVQAIVAPSEPEIRRPKRLHSKIWMGAAVAILLGIVAFAIFRPAHPNPTATSLSSLPSPGPAISSSTAAVPDVPDVRIMAGRGPGRYTDRDGQVWEGDRYFRGGEAVSTRNDILNRGFDRNIFAGMREGRFEYDIPLKPGTYEAELFFVETVYGEGNPLGGGESSRLFEIRANGTPLVTAFDILADAGLPNATDSRLFGDLHPAPDGYLHLTFEPQSRRKATVSAICVRPSLQGRMNPIRIVARPQPYRDPKGNWWSPDRYYLGGIQILRPDVPFSFDEAYVFQGERYGNFTYSIPVLPGKYRATLYFYEYWWGRGHPGGVGSRRFNVYCNFKPLLTDFEIVGEGSSDQAVKKTFHGLTPNAQGKLVFAFVPTVNYAMVNAIEIVDESR